MTSTSPVRTDSAASLASSGPARIRVAAAALAASAATVGVLLAAPPWGDRLDSSSDEFLDYDKLLEVRDAAWVGMLVDGFAYAVIGLTLGLGVLHLARGRGRVAALVGAVLTSAGGVLFAIGAGAFATFSWFATAPGLPDDAGRALVDYANDHVGHVIGADMAGFVVFTLGTLVLSAAMVRARAVPVAWVVVFVLATLAQFALPAGSDLLNYVQIAMMALLVGLATLVWRGARADA
jgi:hypothetical protein